MGGSGPCWWVQERDAPAGLQRSGAPLPALPISPALRPYHPLEGIEHLPPSQPREPRRRPPPPRPFQQLLTLFLEAAGALPSTRCALGTTDGVGRGAGGGNRPWAAWPTRQESGSDPAARPLL